METNAPPTTSAQGRRQNPSRSKRGGPGIGTCDVDLMILESYKRKLETEPLIPADTPFVLTTNSSKYSGSASSNGETAISINTVANDRYFDRPEVLRAFREQEIIQTPEFWSISESSSVGGRFRPRGAEDESAETSDAAYEKRHKKFETFEKRQRLREKEKLKHEHYKLKERIDQLRATDSSAFMSVPATTFWTLPPPDKPLTQEDTNDAPGVTPEQLEGERRKKEILDHAISLEKRYSYLLPSDRARKTQDSFVADKVPEEDELDSAEGMPQASSSKKDSESIRFRIPARSSLSMTPVSSPAAIKAPKKTKTNSKQAVSSRSAHNSVSTSAPPPDHASSISSPILDVEMRTPETEHHHPPTPPPIAVLVPLADIELPISATRVTAIKPTTSIRQTNGKGRAQKEAHARQVANTSGLKRATPKPSVRKNKRTRVVEAQLHEDGESEKAPSDEEIDEVDDLEDEIVNKEESVLPADADLLASQAREAATRLEQEVLPPMSPGNVHEGDHENHNNTELDVRQPSLSSTMPVQSPSRGIMPEPEPAVASAEPEPEQKETATLPEAESQHENELEPQVEEESISMRPAKRQRKMSAKARAQSLAQSVTYTQSPLSPSAPPGSPQAVSQITTTRPYRKTGKTGPRGQQSQVYISSTTGQEVRTTSFLMMAAIRSESAKRNVEKRHNTSFGIPTPAFKDNYDFEIPEWMHYPEDEEPVIPLPDDYAEHEQHMALVMQNPPVEAEQSGADADLNKQTEDHVTITTVSKEPEPIEHHTETLPVEEEQADKNDDTLEEAIDQPMDVELNDVESIHESPPPTEPETEPGVAVRVLSSSRDDDDEELIW